MLLLFWENCWDSISLYCYDLFLVPTVSSLRMKISFIIFFFFYVLFFNGASATPRLPDHFTKSRSQSTLQRPSGQEFFELRQPLPSDHLTPACTVPILDHYFANTIGSPPVSVPYKPPRHCHAPWSRVVLEVHADCKGEQYDRIAAVWLGGVEILRTSTAEPDEAGIFWNVQKDVTRYSSLLKLSNQDLTMMLENIVDDIFTGVYHVQVSLLYYKDKGVTAPADKNLGRELGFRFGSPWIAPTRVVGEAPLSLYEPPADLIVPISNNGDRGFWFRINGESDVRTKRVQIPRNTRRAVIELYVSFHGNDEFWYSNPPNSYIRNNNLTTDRGNGAFREVYVTVDGNFVGSEVPYPVIFTGGINPLFWEPVVAIGAFDLPSYDFELTPFLGLLLDGNTHNFGIGVSYSIPFWLVDANLHLWLDHQSEAVQAKLVSQKSPALTLTSSQKFKRLDGTFELEGSRKGRYVGWVKSSEGNLTTIVSRKLKFRNAIQFRRDGNHKTVEQKIKSKTQVKVLTETRILLSRPFIKWRYPLKIITSTRPGSGQGTNLITTNVTESLGKRFANGNSSIFVYNSQVCGGYMEVKDHSVVSGVSDTTQSFRVRDGSRCFSRVVASTNGKLLSDSSSTSCASSV